MEKLVRSPFFRGGRAFDLLGNFIEMVWRPEWEHFEAETIALPINIDLYFDLRYNGTNGSHSAG